MSKIHRSCLIPYHKQLLYLPKYEFLQSLNLRYTMEQPYFVCSYREYLKSTIEKITEKK